MTITEPTSIIAPAAELNAEVLAAAEACRTRRQTFSEQLATSELLPGQARRGGKLTRQLYAAERLLARGAGLVSPPALLAITHRAGRSVEFSDLGAVDAQVVGWTGLLGQLHAWRGHTSSVKA